MESGVIHDVVRFLPVDDVEKRACGFGAKFYTARVQEIWTKGDAIDYP